MSINPFCGRWGFGSKPVDEPDNRFEIPDTEDPNQVRVIFHTPRTESTGHTAGGMLRFDRRVEETNLTIHYHSARPFPPDPGFDGKLKGKFKVTRDSDPDRESKSAEQDLTADDDWVGNRPA